MPEQKRGLAFPNYFYAVISDAIHSISFVARVFPTNPRVEAFNLDHIHFLCTCIEWSW